MKDEIGAAPEEMYVIISAKFRGRGSALEVAQLMGLPFGAWIWLAAAPSPEIRVFGPLAPERLDDFMTAAGRHMLANEHRA